MRLTLFSFSQRTRTGSYLPRADSDAETLSLAVNNESFVIKILHVIKKYISWIDSFKISQKSEIVLKPHSTVML